MRNYLITSVVDNISANTNLFSLYLTIVGHCCLHQVISRQVCWQSQIIEWDNPGQPCYCAERQIHISLKFNLLFLWYSREWIGVPKSFKSKDGKSYPNRSKTHRNMKISTVASYSLRFFLFSWPVLGDETLNSYLPTTIKMRGTSLTCIYCTENLSPFWSLLAQPARGAYLGFLRVLLLPPVWDASPLQGYP